MFVKISLHASNVHEQSTCINFEIFIFMGFRLSVKLLLIVRNNLWVVGEILIHFVILCFNSLPHYQSMLMQTPEKGGDCVERWPGLEFWWSLRNPSKNLSLTFVWEDQVPLCIDLQNWNHHPTQGTPPYWMFYLFRALKGGWPLLRSVPSHSVPKSEAKRLVDTAAKVLIATVSGEFPIPCFTASYQVSWDFLRITVISWF